MTDNDDEDVERCDECRNTGELFLVGDRILCDACIEENRPRGQKGCEMQIRDPEEGEIQRQLPEQRWHLAVCVDVLDPELKQSPQGKGQYFSERLIFQLEQRRDDGSRFLVGRALTYSPLPKGGGTMSKKTRALLGTWIGKRNLDNLTDTKQLIGRSAMLQIEHQNGWANILAMDPPETDLPPEPYVRRTKEDRQQAPKDDTYQPPGEEVPF